MMTHRMSLTSIMLALGAATAAAQTPSQAPPPPAPVVVAQPAPLRPSVAPPPPAALPARAPAAANRPAQPVEVRPMTSGGVLADSVTRAVATEATPPADAVAQCADGSFVRAPRSASDCAGHRGIAVVMPRPTPPPPAPTLAAPRPEAVRAPISATPPSGATMQCRDGTWLYGTPADNRCAGHQGTAAILVPPRAAPAAPAVPRRP